MNATYRRKIDLTELVSEEEWALDRGVIEAARAQGLPFALGGGLAFSCYSGRWRNTKDIDLFILPEDRQAIIDIVTEQGFRDYYDQSPYDRSWIYRAFLENVIVDLIWTMPNHRMKVDAEWLRRGWEVSLHGDCVRLLPPEELLWSKLFVMQYDRCDWPDLFNLLHGVGTKMDWHHLIDRLGEDIPVLAGLMSVYSWLCPSEARRMPAWIWERMGIAGPASNGACGDGRAWLLDTRDWFGAKRQPAHGGQNAGR